MSEERDALANRIRQLIGDDPNITEMKMFGGIAFMLNGNMLIGPHKDGSMMVRVGPDQYQNALARPGAGLMDFTGKPMKGFVNISKNAIASDQDLAEWIALATNFVGTLPAKSP